MASGNILSNFIKLNNWDNGVLIEVMVYKTRIFFLQEKEERWEEEEASRGVEDHWRRKISESGSKTNKSWVGFPKNARENGKLNVIIMISKINI